MEEGFQSLLNKRKSRNDLYDIEYRSRNKDTLKEKKRAYFQRTYNPEKESLKRKTDAYREKHRNYLRQPKWKEYKKRYDAIYLSTKKFGHDWAVTHRPLIELEKEIKKHMSKYEIRLQNHTINKAQIRIRNGTTERGYA